MRLSQSTPRKPVPTSALFRPASSYCNPADIMRPCNPLDFLFGVRSIDVDMKRNGARRRGIQRVAETGAARVIGGRPAGCPARFCGCGASLHLFGRIIPRLNLAANWLRFPRAAPAPKMVAARRGHVFVLEQHVEGNKWLVFDANSGGRLTRMHVRSIAGFAIVNPHGEA